MDVCASSDFESEFRKVFFSILNDFFFGLLFKDIRTRQKLREFEGLVLQGVPACELGSVSAVYLIFCDEIIRKALIGRKKIINIFKLNFPTLSL